MRQRQCDFNWCHQRSRWQLLSTNSFPDRVRHLQRLLFWKFLLQLIWFSIFSPIEYFLFLFNKYFLQKFDFFFKFLPENLCFHHWRTFSLFSRAFSQFEKNASSRPKFIFSSKIKYFPAFHARGVFLIQICIEK